VAIKEAQDKRRGPPACCARRGSSSSDFPAISSVILVGGNPILPSLGNLKPTKTSASRRPGRYRLTKRKNRLVVLASLERLKRVLKMHRVNKTGGGNAKILFVHPRPAVHAPGYTARRFQVNLRRLDVRGNVPRLGSRRLASALILFSQLNRTSFKRRFVSVRVRDVKKQQKPKRFR